MITPRQVFRYSSAATAGYATTASVVDWLLSIARWMASIAILSFILAIACLYTWITAPDRDRWLFIYFVGFCFISAVMLAPMMVAAHVAFRYAKNIDQDEKSGG